MRRAKRLLLLSLLITSPLATAAEPDGAALEAQIRAASAALAADTDDQQTLATRAALYAAAGQPKRSIADYDRLLELDPNRAAAYDARGSEHFKLGHVEQSIKDFDRYLKLRPDQEPWHWKRGISYYYANRYDDGRRQFEGYQTVDDNDVENAVWRFLCMARGQGIEKARDDMLKIKHDRRVPMMEIYALYQGQAEPEDVLAAANAGTPAPAELHARLFYAHLYLGLYYELVGDTDRTRKHLSLAADTYKIGHYMWNVADVHAKRLQGAANK